ncbi:TetR/AcrR family transcriptional regulator [Hydrogenophaga sp.]|uniref:TetR/AcrR family transcriptional regulator n=1 Tax=Hydrogenophaga sp. TaxID=1904254 RepID=UPI003D151ACB
MATNPERSAHTRAQLLGVARALFAQHGFAATSTEAILAGAGVKRGALYHHFTDKAALFEAVCVELVEEALPAVDAATARAGGALDALIRGSIAWIEFVTRDDVRRILLVDGPTVLGWQRWHALDDRLSVNALRAALRDAISAGELSFDGDPELLTTMTNGALNALALEVGNAVPPPPARQWQRAVRGFWRALAR